MFRTKNTTAKCSEQIFLRKTTAYSLGLESDTPKLMQTNLCMLLLPTKYLLSTSQQSHWLDKQ